MLTKTQKHHLVSFYADATPEGQQIQSTCTCGAELMGVGSNRIAASDHLWQVFELHKAEPRQASANVKFPELQKKQSDKDTKKHPASTAPAPPAPQKPIRYLVPRSKRGLGLTAKELAEIARNIQAGQTTVKKAARELGACRSALYNNLHKAGLSLARATMPDQVETITHPAIPSRRNAGLTYAELADLAEKILTRKTSVAQTARELGVSPATLYSAFRKAGLRIARTTWPDHSDGARAESIIYLTSPSKQVVRVTYNELADLAAKIRTRQISMAQSASNLGVCRGTLARAFRQANLSIQKVESAEERFHCLITIVPDSGCWQWNGRIVENLPHFWSGTNTVNARRYAWSLKYGALEENVHVYVTCGNRLCVNPDHLTAS